ncbi:S-adenosyl-L-methionine-dependent methyltransferase [Chaetomium sp. MPI-CAGE-AT-0009]|nr:S-adenosyl-L-methionine-dependent methyltransferase [Chaetomium sp. MPI-CAGE-AT-0009]
MPRLPPSLFWRARCEISPMAAQLLPACRDLQSAANELRWIREYVQDTKSPIPAELRVWKLVEKRAKGIPLQYVLGTQPFGNLEIKCRPGVLIPRPETEAYTLHLATLLSQPHPPPPSLTILDLCTGTGCIPLLLLHSLQATLPPTTPITIHGVDISPSAIALARTNHAHNPPPTPSPHHTLTFHQHDIFSPTLLPSLQPNNNNSKKPKIDLLISNPPYISPSDFARNTARAVRNYEPRLALVPDHHNHHNGRQYACRPEDVFYARLLEIAAAVRPRRVLMEVGGWGEGVERHLACTLAVVNRGVPPSRYGAGLRDLSISVSLHTAIHLLGA